MNQPFLIRHPDGREYELSDYGFFLEEYEPAGFTIVNPAPAGYWGGPELNPAVEESASATTEMTRAELNEAAAQLGIEKPEALPNKQAVIDAIAAKQAELDARSDPDAAPE